MNGTAYQDPMGDIKALLPETPYEFDKLEWLYCSQAGWNSTNFEAMERMHEQCLVNHQELEHTDTNYIKKNCFTWASEFFYIDEWTYFLGLESVEDFLTKNPNFDLLDKKAFDYIKKTNGVLLVWVDGWWECYSTQDELIQHFNKKLKTTTVQSTKWSPTNIHAEITPTFEPFISTQKQTMNNFIYNDSSFSSDQYWYSEEDFIFHHHTVKFIIRDKKENYPSEKIQHSLQKALNSLDLAINEIKASNKNYSDQEINFPSLSIRPYFHDELVCIRYEEKELKNWNELENPHEYFQGKVFGMLNYCHGKFVNDDKEEELYIEYFNNLPGPIFEDIKFVRTPKRKAPKDEISQFEKAIGLDLPPIYKTFLEKVNGGSPSIPGVSEDNLPHFNSFKDEAETYDNLWRYLDNEEGAYATQFGLIPISDKGDQSGGQAGIYCKPGQYYGQVFIWHYESALFSITEPLDKGFNKEFFEENKVANDFQGYLEYLIESRTRDKGND